MGNTPSELSPRQRMINMMYLVLTAMLALNVSKEVLNAFIVVNDGLEKTNQNFSNKTNMLYNEMDKQFSLDSAKVKKYHEKRLEVEDISQDMVEYIEHLQNLVIAYTEDGDTTDLTTTWITPDEEKEVSGEWREKPVSLLSKRDNYDSPTHLMVPDGDSNPKKGYGYKLKQRIEKFKTEIRALFDDVDTTVNQTKLNLGLNTDDVYNRIEEKEVSWQTYNFYHSVLVADLVMFNKIIAEVRNAEADAINRLLSMISVQDFKFDDVDAKVVPKSNYVISGDKYQADIFVAAISKTQQPEVYILEGVDTASQERILEEGKVVEDTAYDGMVNYIAEPGSTGEKSFSGIVKMRKPGREGDNPDDFNYYPFNSSYVVAQPTAVISATKVNVLYRGVDNPVEVSAPGIAASKLSVSASNATVKGGQGEYQIRPGGSNETVVNVAAKQDDGSTRQMGKMEFRVKKLPDPEIMLAGKKSGNNIRKVELKGSRLYPSMGEALFDVSYKVKRFTMDVTVGQNTQSYNTTGDRLSAEMKQIVDRLQRGATVAFKNIQVEGPDGTRPISGVFYTIQ
ncbi:MAG: GldM family protein [Bacteroidales bacterium]